MIRETCPNKACSSIAEDDAIVSGHRIKSTEGKKGWSYYMYIVRHCRRCSHWWEDEVKEVKD